MASTTTNTKPLAIVEFDADTTFKIEDEKYPVPPPYIYTPSHPKATILDSSNCPPAISIQAST
jgi:hypothetical protein